MEIKDLYNLVNAFLGYKANMLYMDDENKEIGCILYNSFLLRCNLDKRYGSFGAGIVCGKDTVITTFLGKKCSLNGDDVSIKQSLQIIDNYCRLRLPDKFLIAFDEAYLDKMKD